VTLLPDFGKFEVTSSETKETARPCSLEKPATFAAQAQLPDLRSAAFFA
jgi:hypothetical protein